MGVDDLQEPLQELPVALARLQGEIATLAEAEWLQRRDRIVRQAEGLTVRLARRDDPLLVVVAGGTGSGKSTVANTLAQAPVVTTGVRRPTTNVPTVLGRAADLDVLRRSELLADLAWSDGAGRDTGDGPRLHRVAVESLPEGLCLVDTPDIDSVQTTNRAIAEVLLDVADLWLWLTSARTYADEAGMAYLRHAAQFDTSVTVVVTQVADRDREELVVDVRRRLDEAGQGDAELLVVPYVEPEHEQLPSAAAAEVHTYVVSLAEPATRSRRRLQTVAGAAAALPGEIDAVLSDIEDERVEAAELRTIVERTYDDVPEQVLAELRDGVPLQREVLGQWQELIGRTRIQEYVETASGRITEWMRELLPHAARDPEGERETAAQAGEAVTEAVATVLVAAATTVEAAWQRQAAGRLLLRAHPSVRRSDDDVRRHRRERVEALVQAWRDSVVDHVRTVGQQKVTRARRWNAGVNAFVTTGALVLFSLTGGLTGAEVALTAGGSATVHTVLKKILGEKTLNDLIAAITDDLRGRVSELAEEEATGYRDVLEGAVPSADAIAAATEVRDDLARAAT